MPRHHSTAQIHQVGRLSASGRERQAALMRAVWMSQGCAFFHFSSLLRTHGSCTPCLLASFADNSTVHAHPALPMQRAQRSTMATQAVHPTSFQIPHGQFAQTSTGFPLAPATTQTPNQTYDLLAPCCPPLPPAAPPCRTPPCQSAAAPAALPHWASRPSRLLRCAPPPTGAPPAALRTAPAAGQGCADP